MKGKRFTEILSVQKIRDNWTGKEYSGLVEDSFLDLVNVIYERLDEKDRLLEKQLKVIDNLTKYIKKLEEEE